MTSTLPLSFDPGKNLQAFLTVELSRGIALAEPRQRASRVGFELKPAFLVFKDLRDGRLSLQFGRQRFNDRAWIYDEELAAVKVFSQ
jgi:hypothetical protein